MKIYIKIYFVFLLLNILFFFPYPLHAELRKVSIKECIEIAIQNHPDIKSSDEDNNIARANYGLAKSKKSPIVNLETKTVETKIVDADGNVVKPKNKVIGIPGSDSWLGLYVGPTVIYNLYNPETSEVIDSAKVAIDLSKMKALKVKSDIILNVTKNYYGYLFATENRAKRQQLVEKFQSKLDMAKLFLKGRERSMLDVTKAEVDLAAARLEYEKALNSENIIKTELLSSLGIMDEDIEFIPLKVEKLPELRFDLKKLYQLAESNNPDVKIARLNKEINQLNVSVASAAHYPYVDILGSIGFVNNNIIYGNPFKDPQDFEDRVCWDNWERTIAFGLTARINLWSGGAIESKTDSKTAEYNKSKYIEREILINIRTAVKNNYQSIAEYKKQIELSELMLENSKKHLQLAQKSWKSGLITQLELQDAEMILLNSELGNIKAGYDYLIIIAKLSSIIGLGEEDICSK